MSLKYDQSKSGGAGYIGDGNSNHHSKTICFWTNPLLYVIVLLAAAICHQFTMRRPIPLSNMLKSSSSSFRQHSIRPLPTHPFVASLPRASHFRMSSQFTLRKVAAPNTLDHRIYVEKDGSPVSIFHDIPLHSNKDENVFNMVVEIPRWTNPKLEVR